MQYFSAHSKNNLLINWGPKIECFNFGSKQSLYLCPIAKMHLKFLRNLHYSYTTKPDLKEEFEECLNYNYWLINLVYFKTVE